MFYDVLYIKLKLEEKAEAMTFYNVLRMGLEGKRRGIRGKIGEGE
jgi:hypothetical protein